MTSWLDTERMSGGPNEDVLLDWLQAESKSTGSVSLRVTVSSALELEGDQKSHLCDSRCILVYSTEYVIQ
jgi:hypothetical protein